MKLSYKERIQHRFYRYEMCRYLARYFIRIENLYLDLQAFQFEATINLSAAYKKHYDRVGKDFTTTGNFI